MARSPSSTRCKYTSTHGTRCSTRVSLHGSLRFPRGGSIPHYCKYHEKRILSLKTITLNTSRSTTVLVKYQSSTAYDPRKLVTNLSVGYIPSYLQPRTQVALRYFMSTPVAASDKSGHIYALSVTSASRPTAVHTSLT